MKTPLLLPVAAVLLGLAFSSCSVSFSREPAPIKVDAKASAEEARRVKAALALFTATCERLDLFWEDVASAEAALNDLPSFFSRAEAYGWRREVAVHVKIRAAPKLIPDADRIRGQTLVYYLGAGRMPGIVAETGAALEFCQFGISPRADGDDLFIPVPGMKILAAPALAAPPPARANPVTRCADIEAALVELRGETSEAMSVLMGIAMLGDGASPDRLQRVIEQLKTPLAMLARNPAGRAEYYRTVDKMTKTEEAVLATAGCGQPGR